MRSLIVITAAVLVGTMAVSSASLAAKKSTAKSSARSFNSCVALAKRRGFSYSDLTNEGTGQRAREFVRNCMNGTQN